MAKYIYCTLVMLSDNYVPGAAVLARSMKNNRSIYPIWCMVDGSVSKDAINFLQTEFDRVIEVPLIQKNIVPMKSEKQRKIYGAWISKSFTKWRVFDPDYFDAEKVIFLDADIQILRNIDCLFDLPGPAATFSSPWAQPYIKPYGIINPYGDQPHGAIIPADAIRRGFSSILGIGSVVLVEPSSQAWNIFQYLLAQSETYGYKKCVSGVDEQILAEIFLAMNTPIYHIHPRFNLFVGKNSWLTYGDKDATPNVYHFYGTKPWEQDRDTWIETISWWEVADEIIATNPNMNKRWFEIRYKK